MISYLFLFPNFFSNTVFNDLQYHILHELAKQSNQQFTLIIIVETQNRKEVPLAIVNLTARTWLTHEFPRVRRKEKLLLSPMPGFNFFPLDSHSRPVRS